MLQRQQQQSARRAANLFIQTQVAFANCEASGIKIDVPYLYQAIQDTKQQIIDLENKIRQTPVWERWFEIFGKNAALTVRHQLATTLFGNTKTPHPRNLGYECATWTEKGAPQVSEESLERIPGLEEFAADYSLWMSLNKMLTTNLKGIESALDPNGFLHPSFSLFSVISYRTSCVAKGTRIMVNRGYESSMGVPIEDVRVGDYVYCFDDELNPRLKKVLWAGKTGHKKVVRVHFMRHGGRKGYIDVTPEHRIRMSDGCYVAAKDVMGYKRDIFPKKSVLNTSVLSIHRENRGRKDRLYATNHSPVMEHVFVYNELCGDIPDNCCIHHRDGKHWNHTIANLELIDKKEHSRHHGLEMVKDSELYAKRYAGLKKAWSSPNRKILRGIDNPLTLKYSGFETIKLLVKTRGRLTRISHDFVAVKELCKRHGIDWKRIKLRYGANGQYIAKAHLAKHLKLFGVNSALREFGIGHARLYALCNEYGLSFKHRKNQHICNNHRILSVEELPDSVDVYDLHVEDCHNFIANEVCVHNSSNPNFQNFPNRGALAAIVRRCFIPRSPDRHLAELDYSGAEVRANASINHDPTLLDSVNHGIDFHKSIAAMSYMLPEEEITKELRQSVKGPYTFAAFYGSYWVGIAEGLWNVIAYGGLKLKDGTPLVEHLRSKGINGLGNSANPTPDSYYAHIKKTEEWFWGTKFKVYAEWKDKVWSRYLKDRYVDLPTGFRCAGIFSKNMVTNFPAQGGAAHCLLWSFVKLDRAIQEMGLQTKICGQIHDSILLDIPHDELDDVLVLAHDIMTKQLPKAQPWLAVPMEIEADVAPMGKSWWDKAPYEIKEVTQDG